MGALLLLTGCAGRELMPAGSKGFSEADATELFATAYRFISERYVEPISSDRLAVSGLQHLHQVAPAVAVRRAPAAISLVYADRVLDESPLPPERDYEAWGRITAHFLHTAWTASPELRSMRTERIYTTVFDGMMTRLDGYSRYTDPATADDARAAREGFGGLGITLRPESGRIVVEAVIEHSPAERAGLRTDDQILAVDGVPVGSIRPEAVAHRLRGGVGTEVTVTILSRGGETPRDVVIRRSHIVPQSVYYRREGDVAVFKITIFNSHTTRELEELVNRAEREPGRPLAGIVLDLRNNPGGLLDQAVATADLFLADGTIVTTRGRHPNSNNVYTASGSDIAEGIPIIVLTNGRSASAAEMLAAALEDLGRAVVVGSTTHGKGSVQNLTELPNGGELVITWSRMIAPSGYVIDKLGVLPSICTSADGSIDPIEQRRGGRSDQTAIFTAWHRYEQPNPIAARTLRLACPSEDQSPGEDIQIAKRLLASGPLYRTALRPAAGVLPPDRLRVERFPHTARVLGRDGG